MSENHPTLRSDDLTPTKWGAIFYDIFEGLKLWRIWTALSWQEFRSTYRRSIFGVLWVMASFAGFIVIKLVIFTELIPTEDGQYYNAYLTVGFYLWFYIVLLVNSAPLTFVSAAGWIRVEPLPFSLYVFKNIMRELYNFGLTFFVALGALIYIGFEPSIYSLYAIPAILFYVVNAIWLKFLLGIVGARFRDLGHLVSAVTLPLLFLTPIFWLPEQMGDLMKYLWWNPFFHYLEIYRAPVVAGVFPTTSWIFVLTLFVVGWGLAIISYAQFRRRIVFWV